MTFSAHRCAQRSQAVEFAINLIELRSKLRRECEKNYERGFYNLTLLAYKLHFQELMITEVLITRLVKKKNVKAFSLINLLIHLSTTCHRNKKKTERGALIKNIKELNDIQWDQNRLIR